MKAVAAAVLLAGSGIGVEAGVARNATSQHIEHDVALKSVTAHASQKESSNIVPPLEDVASDKKFFGPPFPADYPHDIQPPMHQKASGGMYPKVQEEGFFDKDYVKDENSDGGLYEAQMDYDKARTKIHRHKVQAENAAKRAANEARDVEAAAKEAAGKKAEADRAADGARKAGEEAGKAKADADKTEAEKEAARKARKAAAESAAKEAQDTAESRAKTEREAMEKKVKDAEDALAKQRVSYQDCLKDLQEAKAKVEALQKERDILKSSGAHSPEFTAKQPDDSEAERAALAEAKKKQAEAEAKEKEASKKLSEASGESAKAKKTLDEQKAENDAANKKLEKEEKELKEAEQELAASKKRLREIRGIDSPPPKEKSHASMYKASLAVIAAIFAASALA